MTLAGRVVLVTGGAKRLGRAIALALARGGARVAFSYRTSAAGARDTVRRLEADGVETLAVRVDLARPDGARMLVGAVQRRFGRLDVLVNSAATFERTPYERLTARAWDAAMAVNLRAAFLCSLHASRLMRRQGGGKIIHLADWAGIRPYRDYLPYCVSKAGVIGLTKALAKELAPVIQVNAIAPGPILPPAGMGAAWRKRIARRVPLKRWGDPEDIASAVRFLIEGTDFMTGSVLAVDGGQLIA